MKMILSKKSFLIMIVVFLHIVSNSLAQDWPQYLGPDRNSTSPQKGLLKTWAEGIPQILWSVNVGNGYGGPVVKNGKVYLLDRDDEAGDIMRCFNLQSGEELWKFDYPSPGSLPFPGSRSVPIVDEHHVYSCGHSGNLYCIDIQTHQPVWNKNIWTDFGGTTIPVWGISQCPLIYGEFIIIASQAPQAGIVAFNKNTGDIIWKTPRLAGDVTYSSPNIIKIHGEDHIVFVTSSTNPFQNQGNQTVKGTVSGIDARSGKILWQYNNWNCHISVPSVVDAGNNKLLIAGGYELGATLIQVNKKPDGAFDISEFFSTTEFGDQTKPPLFHNGYFYAMYRTNTKRDGFICMDMDGKILWKTGRNPDFDRGSMILADGLILATDGAQTLYLIEPDPKAFKVISKAAVLKEGGASTEGMSALGGSTQNWAPIALADGKLLIRDQSRLLCVKVTQ